MKIKVLNPVSIKVEDKKKRETLAPRLDKLDDKVIGLFWNYKPGGDSALKRTSELLEAQFPGVKTKHYMGSRESSLRYLSKSQVEEIVRDCSAVIGTTAD